MECKSRRPVRSTLLIPPQPRNPTNYTPNLPAAAKNLLLPRLHLYHRRHLGALQVDLGVDLGLKGNVGKGRSVVKDGESNG